MSVWNKNNQPSVNVKRNTFDCSYQTNVTANFGYLYPVSLLETLPGDTAKIDVAFGLRGLPLAFPVQTKIRCDIHYFYVRNRNLWKDWTNFIGMTGDTGKYEMPQVTYRKYCQTGGLGDYLGLPTTVIGENPTNLANISLTYIQNSDWYLLCTTDQIDNFGSSDFIFDTGLLRSPGLQSPQTTGGFQLYRSNTDFGALYGTLTLQHASAGQSVFFDLSSVTPPNTELLIYALVPTSSGNFYDDLDPSTTFTSNQPWLSKATQVAGNTYKFDVLESFTTSKNFRIIILSRDNAPVIDPLDQYDSTYTFSDASTITLTQVKVITESFNVLEAKDLPSASLNYMPRISALPFRAYESIYNSFYRDQRNNPYLVNGIADPNVYLPTTDGGLDTNDYVLHKRNWEQDFLTSAVPSPQQGVAPLVGLTATGVASFLSEDGETYNVQMTTDDGDNITGAQLTRNLPNDVNRAIVNVATEGISINDFRGVNALQRWLETNIRRGLKYKDQLYSHFGVNASYSLLDMPEFIGGVTQMLDIQQINQTSASTDSDPLGSYAGQAMAVGGNNHTISHYCDEHGFIIGIMSIVPVPCYSQLLPKKLLKTQPLDYFFPEFGHIGLQPIPYKEVCPLQVIQNGYGSSFLNKTFGYQRAWYDYLGNVDEVHGQFRTSLRHFLLGRVYNTLPSLNADFLTVDPKQLNNIFTVTSYTGDDGKEVELQPFLGQLHFKIIMKRPIPRFGIPRLE